MLLCSNALVVAHCTLVRHLLTDPRQSDILPFGPGRGTNAIRSTKTREFITLLGGAAIAWPLAARAQQGENPTRIGFLPIGLPSNAYDQSMVEAFRQGLREAGLVDGRTRRAFCSTVIRTSRTTAPYSPSVRCRFFKTAISRSSNPGRSCSTSASGARLSYPRARSPGRTRRNGSSRRSFKWVPEFAYGQVRDLRARWALEEAGLP